MRSPSSAGRGGRIVNVATAGAGLAEQLDEWAVVRRYVSVESLVEARLTAPPTTIPEESIALPTAG